MVSSFQHEAGGASPAPTEKYVTIENVGEGLAPPARIWRAGSLRPTWCLRTELVGIRVVGVAKVGQPFGQLG